MKKIILALIACSFLGACVSNDQPVPIEVPKYKVVEIPPKLMQCAQAQLPKSFQSNKDVALEITQLYKIDLACHTNMLAIKKFEDQAKATIENDSNH